MSMQRKSRCKNKNSKLEILNFVRQFQSSSKRERSLLGVFVVVMEFSMLCTYVINICSFLNIPQAEQWEKNLCRLGWANRDAMRHCRSCWQWDESVYQQEQYLLHLAWAPLHPGRLPFEGGDSSHDDSNQHPRFTYLSLLESTPNFLGSSNQTRAVKYCFPWSG